MEKIKLFCFPYAGGMSTAYSHWRRYLAPYIELNAIELAGRGSRMAEPFYESMEAAVNDVYEMIKDQLDDMPYAFFGHSMGSIIAYELCHKIIGKGHKAPQHIFFSGRRAPHVGFEGELYHKLPEDEFEKTIMRLGGTPREIFEHEELKALFIPVLKADFKVVETYEYRQKEQSLSMDISVLYGKADDRIQGSIGEWAQHTTGKCTLYPYEGGHFFIHQHTASIAGLINGILRPGI